MSIRITETIHPETKQVVKEGDVVIIYQGRFGHNNIMTIKSIWDHGSWVGVSENEEKMSTHVSAIKEILTPEKLRKIQKDISRARSLPDYKFVN